MLLAELKKKIGAEISFRYRDSLLRDKKVGVLREVEGKNLLIDSVWYWYPDLCDIVVERGPDPPVRKTRKKPT
jgi:hypothetical protein